MKTLLLAFLCGAWLSAAGAPASAADKPPPVFSEWFDDGTLRLDYYHHGSAKTERVAFDNVIREGTWAGPLTHLTDTPDYGKYRFKVRDKESRRIIFEGGYSTLFGEWQTTEEARTVERAFHESVRFPLPRKPVAVEIWSKSNKGKAARIGTFDVDPASHLVRKLPVRKDVEILITAEAGDPHHALDVVILCDGYTQAQAEKARRDLKRYTEVLLTTRPFSSHKEKISVRGIVPLAQYTGPDEPRKGLFHGSELGTTFNTFDSERYLTTVNNVEMRNLAAQVPYDTVFIMVNSSRYGGGGVFNLFSVFVSDNDYDEYVFIHEFGHSFAGLGDEYYTSSVAYSEFYPRGVEPWEPNITALTGGAKKLKWRTHVTPGAAIPTPPTEENQGKVGAFEGAGYAAKGLYRPAFDCKMFSKKSLDFCPVCASVVEDWLRYYTE